MPFIRYTRDKRGYETTFVMHGYRPAQGPQRTRVLYLFRSPAHVKFGRRPLDEESREALEHTHPDLSFDWTVLGRESEAIRGDARERDRGRDRDRDSGRGGRRGGTGGRQARPAPPPVVIDDQTLLGRTLGADVAARYRARFSDLCDRITRRARTPEERDRLLEAAQRLNPDDWPDAESVRAHAETIEADWDAVAAELPARRRGRRGGRRREAGGGGEGDGNSRPDPPDPGSGIMAGDGEVDEPQADFDAAPGGSDGVRGPDAGGDGAGEQPGRHDVPGDDQLRQD